MGNTRWGRERNHPNGCWLGHPVQSESLDAMHGEWIDLPRMRRSCMAIAVALALTASAIPVLADGGLPQVATLRAGPLTAQLYDNAPTLVTGSNTLTLQVPALPDHHAVNLSLAGPHGQRLDVPLRQ